MIYQISDLNDVGKRLDSWLVEILSAEIDISRTGVQKLIENGSVNVNGIIVKANYKTRINDNINIILPEPTASNILPENIHLDVLYEDANIIVVNKPQGMVVHPAPGHYSGTLVNGLMYHCGESLSGINGVLRPGIVHRIDRDTSGVLVVAKTDLAHRSLSEQLFEHSVLRIYKAIATGLLDEKITINKPIARHKTDRKKMSIDQSGRRAVTHITPLKRLERTGKHTLIKAQLETGRTHQIRVHLASIGRPLLGDMVYGRSRNGLVGQVLHAEILGFLHPSTKEYLEFKATLPDYFETLLNTL